jgi:uncharacterized protein YecE (DUF72 family)
LSPIRIGTSGYSYSWNQSKPNPFKWYIAQGFNSVEINASFYRFPPENWIKTWLTSPKDFTFSIKVHRSITHYTRLKGRSSDIWNRFRRSLQSLENDQKIDFWLFQMPSNYKYKQENLETLRAFFETISLGNKAVVEFRDPLWWKSVKVIVNTGVAFCSVDAPSLPHRLIAINNVVYLRLHGSKEWYNYVYCEEELQNILSKIKKLKANKKVIYLNNDHGMLKNGQYFLKHA